MSEDLRPHLKKIIEAGYQISAEGFEYLKTVEASILGELIDQTILKARSTQDQRAVLDLRLIQDAASESAEKREPPRPLTGKSVKRPLASEHDAEIKFLDDQPGEPTGSSEGFLEYFRSRYRKISEILRDRMDVRDAMTIGQALKMPLRSKFKVIGMVTRRNTRGEHLFMDLEDAEDSVAIMASGEEALRKGQTLLDDQVICVDAVKYRQDLLIANDFIWPDVASKAPRRSEVPLCAAFLADVHVGSKLFMADLFERFLRWINLDAGPPESRNLASQVKYVIIDGDLIDGIGIYPNQENELAIADVREQYNTATTYLSKIPDYVEMIVIPGNHDAVRKSLPQPPIPQEYAEPLYQDKRIHMLGNPCRLLLNGVEALIYHGKALDDVLSQTPGMDFNSPEKGIELLLRCRHLAPAYGATTPLAPEKEDRLVISSSPDVLQMGHIHRFNSVRYKGVTLISSAPWQSQTSYQKRMNLSPTPGIAPIFDLQTHKLYPIDIARLG